MTTTKVPRWIMEVNNILALDQPDQGNPEDLPEATRAAIQNLKDYPDNWNYPNSSPKPDPAEIEWLARCLASTMPHIPQPDLGWSADQTFLLYWTGETRHIDLEIFPKELRGELLAYDLDEPDQRAEQSIALRTVSDWQRLAQLAQKAMSHG